MLTLTSIPLARERAPMMPSGNYADGALCRSAPVRLAYVMADACNLPAPKPGDRPNKSL